MIPAIGPGGKPLHLAPLLEGHAQASGAAAQRFPLPAVFLPALQNCEPNHGPRPGTSLICSSLPDPSQMTGPLFDGRPAGRGCLTRELRRGAAE
jgi:hypothetical protein